MEPFHVFQPIITTSTAQLMEIDFNLHKTNSSYFSDVDIARSHLVCTLFSKAIEKMRGGTAAYTGSKKPLFGLALGAVSCSFKRELRPYEKYEMWSKIIAWDEKWIYIVTHFVKQDVAKPKSYTLYPQQLLRRSQADISGTGGYQRGEQLAVDNDTKGTTSKEEQLGKHLYATALSKCVFKSGRKTVAPDAMLQMAGLLPPVDNVDQSGNSLDEIEMQRQQGLKAAELLATQKQQNLEAEFDGSNCEALGRHTDGTGIYGVVNTLMQLAHIRKAQVL
jgi:hypothetical protein